MAYPARGCASFANGAPDAPDTVRQEDRARYRPACRPVHPDGHLHRHAGRSDLQRRSRPTHHWPKLDRSRQRHLLSAGDRAAQTRKQATDACSAAAPAACASPTLEAQGLVSALRDRMEWRARSSASTRLSAQCAEPPVLATRSSRIPYGIPARHGWPRGACRHGRRRVSSV